MYAVLQHFRDATSITGARAGPGANMSDPDLILMAGRSSIVSLDLGHPSSWPKSKLVD